MRSLSYGLFFLSSLLSGSFVILCSHRSVRSSCISCLPSLSCPFQFSPRIGRYVRPFLQSLSISVDSSDPSLSRSFSFFSFFLSLSFLGIRDREKGRSVLTGSLFILVANLRAMSHHSWIVVLSAPQPIFFFYFLFVMIFYNVDFSYFISHRILLYLVLIFTHTHGIFLTWKSSFSCGGSFL